MPEVEEAQRHNGLIRYWRDHFDAPTIMVAIAGGIRRLVAPGALSSA